jgi:hypothetical protein
MFLDVLLPLTAFITQAILASQPTHYLYGSAIKDLRRHCRTLDILPASCMLAGDVRIESENPDFSSGFSDVFRGKYNSLDVAVKVLHVHKDNLSAVRKVWFRL